MKIAIEQLRLVFTEELPATDREQAIYWFKESRADGLSVVLTASVHEAKVGVIVRRDPETAIASLHLENCSEVRVLDERRKCIEILHEQNQGGRCFLSLLGNVIIEFTE